MRTTYLFLLCGLTAGTSQAAGLELAIESPASEAGKYFIAVHDNPEAFPDGEAAHTAQVQVGDSDQPIRIQVPAGRYAVAVFQDLNANAELDANLAGVPTEPTGFSRNAQGSMGPPTFDAAAVEIGDDWRRLDIRLTD